MKKNTLHAVALAWAVGIPLGAMERSATFCLPEEQNHNLPLGKATSLPTLEDSLSYIRQELAHVKEITRENLKAALSISKIGTVAGETKLAFVLKDSLTIHQDAEEQFSNFEEFLSLIETGVKNADFKVLDALIVDLSAKRFRKMAESRKSHRLHTVCREKGKLPTHYPEFAISQKGKIFYLPAYPEGLKSIEKLFDRPLSKELRKVLEDRIHVECRDYMLFALILKTAFQAACALAGEQANSIRELWNQLPRMMRHSMLAQPHLWSYLFELEAAPYWRDFDVREELSSDKGLDSFPPDTYSLEAFFLLPLLQQLEDRAYTQSLKEAAEAYNAKARQMNVAMEEKDTLLLAQEREKNPTKQQYLATLCKTIERLTDEVVTAYAVYKTLEEKKPYHAISVLAKDEIEQIKAYYTRYQIPQQSDVRTMLKDLNPYFKDSSWNNLPEWEVFFQKHEEAFLKLWEDSGFLNSQFPLQDVPGMKEEVFQEREDDAPENFSETLGVIPADIETAEQPIAVTENLFKQYFLKQRAQKEKRNRTSEQSNLQPNTRSPLIKEKKAVPSLIDFKKADDWIQDNLYNPYITTFTAADFVKNLEKAGFLFKKTSGGRHWEMCYPSGRNQHRPYGPTVGGIYASAYVKSTIPYLRQLVEKAGYQPQGK